MNSETSQSPFPTSADSGGSGSGSGLNGSGSDSGIHRAAQKIHEAVDALEARLGESTEKMMNMHQEYGDMAREQVRANPLAAVGIANQIGWKQGA